MLSAILLAAVCWNTQTNECRAYAPELGITCPGLPWTLRTDLAICPQAAPTPMATPTATPTPPGPTPTPVTYTVQEFLRAADLGYTYIQAMSMVDGVVWGNGGVCCPGIPNGRSTTQIGECVWSIDYNVDPPRFREWWCTFRDTSQLWEVGSVQVAQSDRFKWVVAGQATRRPAVPALQDGAKTPMIWGFGVQSLSEPFFTWANSVGHDILAGWSGQIWPQGILDLGGRRFLYAQTLTRWGEPMFIRRWAWADGAHVAFYDSHFWSAPVFAGFSGIAIDADGSIVTTVDEEPGVAATGVGIHGATAATVSARVAGVETAAAGITVHPLWWPSQGAKKVHVIRSKDEGRSWADAGIVFKAPVGRTLFGCGWTHRSGGGAVQPLLLLCTIGTGKGPDQTPPDWNAAYVAWPGARIPATFGQKPVLWKLPTP